MFDEILDIIKNSSVESFEDISRRLEICVNSGENFINALRQIGIIPECIPYDSSEEKLFAKTSDIVLARAFRELGLKSIVLSERGDSADVIAESKFWGYTLVADAKAFRLSRTAINFSKHVLVSAMKQNFSGTLIIFWQNLLKKIFTTHLSNKSRP